MLLGPEFIEPTECVCCAMFYALFVSDEFAIITSGGIVLLFANLMTKTQHFF